jgi:hypothetical protein
MEGNAGCFRPYDHTQMPIHFFAHKPVPTVPSTPPIPRPKNVQDLLDPPPVCWNGDES